MHFRSLSRLSLLILVGAFVLLFAAAPAGAASLAVSPATAMPGATFQIPGAGFGDGEGLQPSTTYKCPKAIVNCRGNGVYINTVPSALYYMACSWKWVRWSGGTLYFRVLGFKPGEQVKVSYEILAIQGMKYFKTIVADGSGYGAMQLNTNGMRPGHYHWWFTSKTASYCGHYDH